MVSDLIDPGYLIRTGQGRRIIRTRQERRNAYTVCSDRLVALPSRRDVDLDSLLGVLLPGGGE